MNRQFSLNDELNLRDSILLITDYIKLNGRAGDEPRTLVKFIEMLLSGTMPDAVRLENLKKEFQKAFSGNLPLGKLESMLQIFEDADCAEAIRRNLAQIAETLYLVSDSDAFFRIVLKKCSLRFFTQEERDRLSGLIESQQYDEFIYQLIRHGAATPYNVPCFFAERIYDEALTYDFDSPLRYRLMQAAADQGNKRAALEYGNYLAKHGPYDAAFDYLLLALPIQAAVWNAAYLIENHLVGAERLNRFRLSAKIEEKLSAEEFPDIGELEAVICPEPSPQISDDLTYAYKAYFYLAQKGFFKAYNSMAKLLSQKKLVIKADCAEYTAQALARKYYQKAICGGNLTAMCTEGSRLLKQRIRNDEYDPDSSDEHYLSELLHTTAEMDMVRAYYNLGIYYEYLADKAPTPPKSREEIRKIYEKALALDIDQSSIRGDLLIRLGKLTQDPKEKKEYFQNALYAGASDAAYYLAYEDYCRYIESGNPYYQKSVERMLQENLPYMSNEFKDEAMWLLHSIDRENTVAAQASIPHDIVASPHM